jgi:hypothetical protein
MALPEARYWREDNKLRWDDLVGVDASQLEAWSISTEQDAWDYATAPQNGGPRPQQPYRDPDRYVSDPSLFDDQQIFDSAVNGQPLRHEQPMLGHRSAKG